jgi:hypothetical protein
MVTRGQTQENLKKETEITPEAAIFGTLDAHFILG